MLWDCGRDGGNKKCIKEFRKMVTCILVDVELLVEFTF